jgi:hypothetical protein
MLDFSQQAVGRQRRRLLDRLVAQPLPVLEASATNSARLIDILPADTQ